MKTERRHELQTNWLADRVGEGLVVVKPYTKAIVGLLLAGLVVWVAMMFMAYRSGAEQRDSWNKLWAGLNGGSNGADDLELLAESGSKRPSTDWAQLVLADNDLSIGVTEWFAEKAAGRSRLDRALGMYKSAFANSDDPLIREHALYGIGQSEESLCKIDEARKAYEQIVKDYPTGAYFARAKQRLDSLARESTQARYDWFAKVEPPSHVFGKGNDKTGDNSLAFPPELEPLSQFTDKSKTPPPEPKPDTGKSPSNEVKPVENKAADKHGDAKPTESGKAADKNSDKPKPSETNSAAPPPPPNSGTPAKAGDTKAATPPSGPSLTAPPTSETKSSDGKSAENKPAGSTSAQPSSSGKNP